MTITKSARIFSFISLALLIWTGFLIFNLKNAIDTQHRVDIDKTALQTLAKEMQDTSWNLTVAARNYAVTGDESYVTLYNDLVDIRGGKKPRPQDNFVAPGQTINIMDLIRKYDVTEQEMSYLREVLNRSQTLGELEGQVFEMVKSGKQDEARATMYSKDYEAKRKYILEPLLTFDRELVSRISKDAGKAADAVKSNIIWVCISIVVNIIVGITNALFIDQRVAKRLKTCASYADRLSAGDYSRPHYQKYSDEIGSMVTALNHMVESLKVRIDDAERATEQARMRQQEAEAAVREAEEAKARAEKAKSEGMLQAADQLSGVVDAVSQVSRALNDGIIRSDEGAREQANLALETAGSMDEMKDAVNAVAKSASDAAAASEHVHQKALEGVEQVRQVTESMTELSEASARISLDMAALGKQANDIGNILSVITDIADQTNLLALNAAIEAARAGEAGRGFAVVADEVRKLAEKTMSATQEVHTAINTIQNSVTKNINSVSDTGAMAAKVTEVVQDSGEVLAEILQLAEGSADQVRAIAAASEEQSASGEHISSSVEKISSISSQTVATMAEADGAVKELLVQADRLSTLINEMKKG